MYRSISSIVVLGNGLLGSEISNQTNWDLISRKKNRFDINDGKLIYRKNKVKAPLNKDYLFKMLQDYFKDNPEIDSNHVSDFILENRPIIEKSILVIKQNKQNK